MSPAHQPTCLLTDTLPLSPRIDISTGGGDDVIFPHVLIYPFTEHRLWAWHADGIGEEGQGIRRSLLFVEVDSVGRALLVGELGEGSSQGSPVAEAPPPPLAWRPGTLPGVQEMASHLSGCATSLPSSLPPHKTRVAALCCVFLRDFTCEAGRVLALSFFELYISLVFTPGQTQGWMLGTSREQDGPSPPRAYTTGRSTTKAATCLFPMFLCGGGSKLSRENKGSVCCYLEGLRRPVGIMLLLTSHFL